MVDGDGIGGRQIVRLYQIVSSRKNNFTAAITEFYDALDHEMADRLKGVMAVIKSK